MKEVSVIIPTYNRAHCIRDAVESVLGQTYPVKEIIVADDCSGDNTKEVLKKIKDERIRYYCLPENKGAGGARNYGVSKASGEYIAFHDSDDRWDLEKLSKQMAYYERHPECGLIYNAFSVLLYGNEKASIFPDMNSGRKLEGDILKELLLKNTIDAPTMLMRRDVFETLGGFDEAMRSLEDWDLALRVARQYPIGFVPEVLLYSENTVDGVSANCAAYYQSRCYMLKKFRTDYIQTGTLNAAVQSILELALADGILPQVEKMLMLYLAG